MRRCLSACDLSRCTRLSSFYCLQVQLTAQRGFVAAGRFHDDHGGKFRSLEYLQSSPGASWELSMMETLRVPGRYKSSLSLETSTPTKHFGLDEAFMKVPS